VREFPDLPDDVRLRLEQRRIDVEDSYRRMQSEGRSGRSDAFDRILRTMARTGLTPRQLDVLWAAAEGKTAAETATELGIGLQTVRTHRAHAMRALGVRTMAAAVHLAHLHGLWEEWRS
jgi:DNA-binding CsgD family transcriptional regulator